MASKLVLIDGNTIMHRAFHALPKMTTKQGEPINAVYGFLAMLLRIIANLKPSHVAVCFDRKEKTFRKKEFKDYQAHRPEMDQDLVPQFSKVRKLVSALSIPVYDKAGFEADDVIGTIVKLTINHYPLVINEVVIVTGDRDILQLVDDRVRVYLPVKGLSEGQLMDRKEVKKKLGVDPELVDDYKALVGDQSDNYQGVPGIGPKTAIFLLEKYKSLDGIYKSLPKIEKGIAEKLRQGKESARLSYKLAQIVTNVPIKFSFEQAGKWDLDSDTARSAYAELNFRTLAKRARKLAAELISENQMNLL